jgi:tetratricopeptide (TPR) repeat protein
MLGFAWRRRGPGATPCPCCHPPRQVASKVAALKSEGSRSFTRRDYVKALEAYEQANKLLPEGAPDKVDLHNYKAACFFQLRRCGCSCASGIGGQRSAHACPGPGRRSLASRRALLAPCCQPPTGSGPSPPRPSPPPLPLRRFKDATRESTNALQLAPSNAKALQRRARSLEQQGLYKQALSDIQTVNK